MRAYKEKEVAIFEAAWPLFAERGFHETKVGEIAREAGIGKGTIYEYFSSKEDLVQEMVTHWISRSYARLEAQLSEIRDPEAQVRFMVHHDLSQGVDLFRTMKILQVIERIDRVGLKDSVMEILLKRQELTRSVFEAGMEQGIFVREDARMLAMMYNGLLNNAMMSAHFGSEAEPDEEALTAFLMRKLK